MSITGKSTLSIKKTDIQGQKLGSTGFRKITFSHKAAAGETSITLSALVTPPELLSAGFTQPSPALLASANLKFFRNNLTLISSARGVLQDYLSYTVNNSTLIKFTEDFGPALDGEIFIGVIDAVPRNDLVGLDATSILASGTLPATQVQFNVGQAFKVNANPSTQIGEIAVYLDGVIQFRNSGNATADPSADGNYQEIDNGSGFGTLIEFNDVDAISDRAVMVVGTGVSIIRPNGSLVQELELLAGQIDAMVPTLAALAGVSESTFQSAPTNADLQAFGNRVLTAEQDIDVLENPTSMDSILATKLGHKQYIHGVDSGVNVTGTSSWATGRAVLIPYQMNDGSWRMRFNLNGTSTSTTTLTLTFAGVVFKNIASFLQAVSISNNAAAGSSGHAVPNTATMDLTVGTASTAWRVSGDVELNSKPSWAS
jgi:hypothetical protein